MSESTMHSMGRCIESKHQQSNECCAWDLYRTGKCNWIHSTLSMTFNSYPTTSRFGSSASSSHWFKTHILRFRRIFSVAEFPTIFNELIVSFHSTPLPHVIHWIASATTIHLPECYYGFVLSTLAVVCGAIFANVISEWFGLELVEVLARSYRATWMEWKRQRNWSTN